MAQCTAHSKQTKQRCRNGSIPGGAVCRFHGGAIPNVKRAAELRVREHLESLLPKGLKRYGKLVDSKQDQVALNTVKDLLDRTGHKPVDVHQDLPYAPEDVERLESLSDEELALYVILRKKVTQAGAVE